MWTAALRVLLAHAAETICESATVLHEWSDCRRPTRRSDSCGSKRSAYRRHFTSGRPDDARFAPAASLGNGPGTAADNPTVPRICGY